MTKKLNVDKAVRERYSAASSAQEPTLCCPVDYQTEYLKIIPQEVIDRDYGCGDPSRYLKEGETVLDLGSGGGKICFIASQIVGSEGSVIGVDTNDEMLSLARDSALVVAERLGYSNVQFKKGMIQDLGLDRASVDKWLQEHPVTSEEELRSLEAECTRMRNDETMIADESIDVVVSNCVLNLVDQSHKAQMFDELFRVLKPGGRAVISDIVSDEIVPEAMRNDPELWSGCISGAYQESEFMEAFEDAGFCGITLDKRDPEPWQVVEDIEFRSVTVVAYKPSLEMIAAPTDCGETVVYKGPFKAVQDDLGQTYLRGERMAISRQAFKAYEKNDLKDHFFFLEGDGKIDSEKAPEFDYGAEPNYRDPTENKSKTAGDSNGAKPGCCG